jgi:hypothetical protein
MGVYVMGAYLISLRGAGLCTRYTPEMHVYEVYAAVGAHLGDTRLGDARLQGSACL